MFPRALQIAAVVVLAGLSAACETTSTTVRTENHFYVSSTSVSGKQNEFSGTRVWVILSKGDAPEPISDEEYDLIVDEFESQAVVHGYTLAESPQTADYLFIAYPYYGPLILTRNMPIYSGGERYTVETYREVERYDEFGRYVGRNRVRDVEYRRTPLVQVGTTSKEEEINAPYAMLLVASAEEFDPAFNYDNLGHDDPLVLAISITAALGDGATFGSHGRCLISGAIKEFPSNHESENRQIPSLAECALPMDISEATEASAS